MDQLQQYNSLADVHYFLKEKRKKHLMRGSFWHAAVVLSIYTSIIVYCKHQRLLDSIMEGIKHNNYLSTTHTDHTTNYMDTVIFDFHFLTHHFLTSTSLMWSNFRVSEQSKFSLLPSRTLGHNALLLMIVARTKLVTSQLESCTDGNLAPDYPVPQAEQCVH